ncbi:MAG: hypothetical protein WKG07_09845 [Hymenobacter sp.]
MVAAQGQVDLSGIRLNMNLTVTPDAYLGNTAGRGHRRRDARHRHRAAAPEH